jgi:hypothetical protein
LLFGISNAFKGLTDANEIGRYFCTIIIPRGVGVMLKGQLGKRLLNRSKGRRRWDAQYQIGIVASAARSDASDAHTIIWAVVAGKMKTMAHSRLPEH